MGKVDEVVQHFGGTEKFCDLFGCSRMAVSRWRNQGGFTAARALEIEMASDGHFRASDIVKSNLGRYTVNDKA